jgi:plastocyanin
MRASTYGRAACTGLAVGMLLAVLAGPASASGGGGCGRPVTDSHGTTVHIRNFCFRPTVLHTKVGGSVTWVNDDPFDHTVSGANAAWGSYEALAGSVSVTYRFTRPGAYPYVCLFHPGMTGAVVVGSGDGPGAARVSTVQPGAVTEVPPPGAAPAPGAVRSVALTRHGSLSNREIAALVVFGLFLWTVMVLGVQRQLRRGTRLS